MTGPGRYNRQKTKRQRDDEQRRQLLDAAAKTFADHGYAKSNVEDVIRAAGLSRATFYKHFESREQLLLALHEHATARVYRHFEAAATAAEADTLSRLETAIRGYLTVIRDNAAMVTVVNRELRSLGPKHWALTERNRTKAAMLIVEGVAAAHAEGVVSRRPDEKTAFALVCAIEGLGMRYIDRGEQHRVLEAVPTLVELVLRAFR